MFNANCVEESNQQISLFCIPEEKEMELVVPAEIVEVKQSNSLASSSFEELTYPISINYGKKDWNIISAIREFLSNMLDTQDKFEYYHKDGYAYITDKGKGLAMKDFIFGESTRDDSQIGQFGEGIKVAFLTLLRYDRAVRIDTVGFTVKVEKTYAKAYDSEVMKLSFFENDKEEGTDVVVECFEEELYEAANLFLDLNQDMKKMDKGVYLPEGRVFIVGLDTNSLPNTIFSYDIEDKSMSNRDRNIVDTTKLHYNIRNIVSDMKNQKAIKHFLSFIETDTSKYEYGMDFNPSHPDVWRKVFFKMYGEKTAMSSDPKSDLYASMMGYKVFRHLTTKIESLLIKIGVKFSDTYADQYNGESLLDSNKIIYPISRDYCENWTVVSAIRELIANALDTDSKFRVEYKNGKCRIVDSGDGIARKHFVFGLSQKEDSEIGQFGEGLKVSSLVLVREGRKVSIKTIGCDYKPTFEYYEDYDMDLFTVKHSKNKRSKGTVIEFDAEESEVEEAKSLFSCFRKKRKKPVKTEKLEVFTDAPGKVFVNGLLTQEVESIFGYDIKDKNLVDSRDRNYIDLHKVKNYLIEFYAYTEEESLISAFLTNWIGMRNAVEYDLNFSPVKRSAWRKAAEKQFKKSCVESYNDKDNFIAKQAGYEVLRNIPSNISSILKMAKIRTASEIAAEYGDGGIVNGNRIVYPITDRYCREWGVVEAIRELISNALDTNTDTSVEYTKGSGYYGTIQIKDQGKGLSKKDFLFSSDKFDGSSIGTFGEGLKIALLVLAREKRELTIESNGVRYVAKMERDSEFDSNVLVVEFETVPKKEGTVVSLQGSKSDVKLSKNQFLVYNSDIKKVFEDEEIYKRGGKLYVNGVHVTNITSNYSYNLTGKAAKKLITRDRNSFDLDKANAEFVKIIKNTKNEEYIKYYLENRSAMEMELTWSFTLSNSVKPVWRRVANKLYPKSCISTGTEYDLAAIDKGYTVLSGFNNNQLKIMNSLGFKLSSDVVTLKGDEKIVRKRINPNKLSVEGKLKWKKAMKRFKKLYGKDRADCVEIVEEFSENVNRNNGFKTMGEHYNGNIYIHVDLLELPRHSFSQLMGILIHEEVHHISGAPDRTREFENALTFELGRIAELYV